MLSVGLLLVVAAFLVTVLAGIGKAPLWVAVLLLCVLHLIGVVR